MGLALVFETNSATNCVSIWMLAVVEKLHLGWKNMKSEKKRTLRIQKVCICFKLASYLFKAINSLHLQLKKNTEESERIEQETKWIVVFVVADNTEKKPQNTLSRLKFCIFPEICCPFKSL